MSGVVPLLQSEAPALQLYEHVVPLLDDVDAFVAVHLSPHAEQFCVVLRSVQVVPPQSVSWQLHEPFLQSGVGWAHVGWFTQLPIEPQVCGVLPLQFVWPGPQTPEQTPPKHVWFVQPAGAPHVPVAVQVSTALPAHVVCPGAQTPVHVPEMHVWLVQAIGVPQVPPPEHVCTELPEHCTAPGEHVPLHMPETHAEFMQGLVVPHVPLAVQVWTPLPEHCVCPGAQTPVHDPLTHVWFVHPAGAPQTPAALHVSTPLPEHWVAPGEQATQFELRHVGSAPLQVVCVCHVPVALHA